jgi:hypothetical protein
MTRVIALMALAALGLSEAQVHEPVHGRRQAISVAVTQRSGRDSSTAMAHLTIWLGEIRDEVERPTLHCRIKPHLNQAAPRPAPAPGSAVGLPARRTPGLQFSQPLSARLIRRSSDSGDGRLPRRSSVQLAGAASRALPAVASHAIGFATQDPLAQSFSGIVGSGVSIRRWSLRSGSEGRPETGPG